MRRRNRNAALLAGVETNGNINEMAAGVWLAGVMAWRSQYAA